MQPGRILSATIVLISALVTGCQSTRTLSVADNNTVQAVYESGVPILKSVKRDTVIVRLLTPEFSKEVNALPRIVRKTNPNSQWIRRRRDGRSSTCLQAAGCA